jgi:protease I
MPDIKQAKILIIATHGFEQSELEVPRDTLRAAGATVKVASTDGQPIRGWDHKDWGRTAAADMKIADARCEDFDALVIPGGQMNPDTLRINDDAMRVVREFVQSGKLVAAICHGPWLLVQADAVQGRQVTSWKSVRKDLENAGALWVDREVVSDKAIITSRSPADLPAFTSKIIEEIREGRHQQRHAAE